MEPDKYEIIKGNFGGWDVYKNENFIFSCPRKSFAKKVIRLLEAYTGKMNSEMR